MVNESLRAEMFIGAEGINTLKSSAIVVFGMGGVEFYAVRTLVRCGVSRLILVDNDTVSPTNVNRQSTALHNTIGQSKVRVTKEKVADICLGTQVITFEEFVLPDNIGSLSEHMELQMGQGNSVDYTPDAIDTVTVELALVDFAVSRDTPVVASMGTGNKLHPELLRVSDISRTSMCPLCKVICRKLKAKNISGLKVRQSPEQPLTPGQTIEDTGHRHAAPRSISSVSPMVGLVIAGTIIRNICELE